MDLRRTHVDSQFAVLMETGAEKPRANQRIQRPHEKWHLFLRKPKGTA
jgi:hypothetical protein